MAFEVMANGTVTSPKGFRAGTAACGLKKSDKLDLAVIASEHECTAAAVFTTNQVAAAPVILDRETLAANPGGIRGVVANAGNANACTGEQGLADARTMQRVAAGQLGCQPDQVLVLSTGVIGAPLPLAKIEAGIRVAINDLSEEGGGPVARAIMTTDTRPKHLALELGLPQGRVTIGGVAKGAGMIHPNMATMLAVLATDANLTVDQLQSVFRVVTKNSFNRISIDGDTSTNDTALILANGASGITLEDGWLLDQFVDGLTYICTELAKMIVRDGEGASKFVEIQVSGAVGEEEAARVAGTIATSPLVKTALAGSDPNWGRIMAAAGRAGVPFDQHRAGLWIGNPGNSALQLVARGAPTSYAEKDAAAVFAASEIVLYLDLGQGDGEATIWTCDLTHEYVSINADYRT